VGEREGGSGARILSRNLNHEFFGIWRLSSRLNNDFSSDAEYRSRVCSRRRISFGGHHGHTWNIPMPLSSICDSIRPWTRIDTDTTFMNIGL
jgi:hypothetical protein